LGLGREKAIEPIILEINDAHELDWDLDVTAKIKTTKIAEQQ